MPRVLTVRLTLAVLLVACTACSGAGSGATSASTSSSTTASLPAVDAAAGVYAHTGPRDLSPAVAEVPSRIYVPNTESDSVDVIDPTTFKVWATCPSTSPPRGT
ncbi:MAG: hypothetical protein LC792_25740 [Actinobacteria bacterium]|nr:hypothetical protein [Actinomycetota bacterium]